MSKALRQKDMWPSNSYARFLWLSLGLWEDILALVDVYKMSDQKETQLIIARHAIVDFDSLDELIKEFPLQVNNEELNRLKSEDQEKIASAFRNYNQNLEPHRELLKKIRNNLGSHRTGMPWRKAPKSGVTSRDEWGKWEQLLSSLEDKCDLNNWVDIFNAAYELLNILKDFNLDAWYSLPDGGEIQFYMPVLPPGYYPEKKPSN